MGNWGRREQVTFLLFLTLLAVVVWRFDLAGELTGDAGGTAAGADAVVPASDGGDGEGEDGAEADPEPGRVELRSRSYSPGDCVTWDSGAGEQGTDVVPCSDPHRIQVVAEVEGPDSEEYPSEEEWRDLYDGVCADAVAEFLGHPLDPGGRFRITGIQPYPDDWSLAHRDVQCGIGIGRPDRPEQAAFFSGDVREAEQQHLWRAGDCIAYGERTGWPEEVPCDEPHLKEIVGRIDLSDRLGPPSAAEQQRLAGDCEGMARDHLGGAPVPPWEVRVETLRRASWEAGSRVVHCYLARTGSGGNPVTAGSPAPR